MALADAGDKSLRDTYIRRGGAAQEKHTSHTGLIILLVCAGLVAAAGGAFAWFKYGRPRLLGVSRTDYVSMASLEEGADYRPPAEGR